jgi:hypothetical protein
LGPEGESINTPISPKRNSLRGKLVGHTGVDIGEKGEK